MPIKTSRGLIWALVLLLVCASALPNFLSESTLARLPDWYRTNQLTLGLDLRGGSYLLLQVDVDDLLQTRNQQAANELAQALREARITHERPTINAEGFAIALRNPARTEEAAQLARSLLLNQAGAQPPYAIDVTPGRMQVPVRRPYVDTTVN
ncbi:MAG TPA: hypothetical protein VNR18_14805, partial [Hyphomicrobiales bacterium]|nr:hypothetical protein [Hyphomicrobiales bacterium]